MKRVRKIISFVLVMAMVCAMSVTALAANSYTITINNSAEGHTYEAYQIFTGDLNADEDTLSNIKWGAGVSADGQTALGDAKEKAESLTSEALAESFAKEVAAYLTTPAGFASTVTDGAYVISGLTPGYYLVKDQDASLAGDHDSYTSYILKVVADVDVTPKSSIPTSEKKVKDVNDSVADSTTDWQDSADYDIGDMVPFQLTGTVADNYDAYTVYKYAFHDTESAGLTFDPSSVEVYVDDTLITEGYEVVTDDLADGCTFEIQFADLKAIDEVEAGSVITVEYESELNENAVLGSAGNPNEMYLEYSNNPNDTTGTETGNTPEDKVIVFTYKVVVNKVDKDEVALPGAGFTLYKKNAAGEYVAVGAEVTGTNMTTFTWTGLDDGDYRLVETTTPDGYNTITPMEFSVSAEHDVLSDNPTLTKLEGGDAFTGELTPGSLETDVINYAGAELPATGGMGTTYLYLIGGIILAGAVTVIVVRRRMSAA